MQKKKQSASMKKSSLRIIPTVEGRSHQSSTFASRPRARQKFQISLQREKARQNAIKSDSIEFKMPTTVRDVGKGIRMSTEMSQQLIGCKNRSNFPSAMRGDVRPLSSTWRFDLQVFWRDIDTILKIKCLRRMDANAHWPGSRWPSLI